MDPTQNNSFGSSNSGGSQNNGQVNGGLGGQPAMPAQQPVVPTSSPTQQSVATVSPLQRPVASTSQPPVSPVQQQPVMSTTQPPVSPAQQPTTQQFPVQQSITPMQQPIMSSGQPVVLTEQGDIILAPQNEKKGKKALIIGGIILSVLALIVIVFFVVNAVLRDNLSFNEYLDKYTKYLVYGSDDTEKSVDEITVEMLSKSEDRNIYNAPRFFDSLSEKNINYYNELRALLTKMRRKMGNDNSSEIALSLESSEALLPDYYIASILAYSNASYNYFVQNGNLEGFLSEYNYHFTNDDSDTLSEFAVAISNAYDEEVEMYDLISKTDCFTKGDRIDYLCLQELDSDEIDNARLKDISNSSLLKKYIENALETLIRDANNMINLDKAANG